MPKTFYESVRRERTQGHNVAIALGYNLPLGASVCHSGAKTSNPAPLCQFLVPLLRHTSDFRLGIGDWIPETNPHSGDCFCGVDRAVDPYRLAGVRVNTSGLAPNEAIMFAAQESYKNGGNARTLVVSEYIGKRLATLPEQCGPLGKISVLTEPSLSDGEAYLLQLDTWVAYEASDGSILNLACESPGMNVRILNMPHFDLQ